MQHRNYRRQRILVTGGAGFVGSHLIDRLLERGDEVLCVDNLFTGDKSNVDHLAGHPRFEFMRHDICFPSVDAPQDASGILRGMARSRMLPSVRPPGAAFRAAGPYGSSRTGTTSPSAC